jgi:hypothetical protein
LKGMVIEV